MRFSRLVIILFLLFHYQLTNAQTHNRFEKADNIVARYPNHPIDNLPHLAHILTDSLDTDIEKYRAIFMWVSHNISNDYYLYRENIRNRNRLKNNPEKLSKWERNYRTKVFKRLNNTHQSMCTGYAFLIHELCLHAGINSQIINGYGRTSTTNLKKSSPINHSWNAVLIENDWYLSDATWSSGYIRSDNKSFVPVKDDSYFLIDPQQFWRTHFPEDMNWILLDNPPQYEDFINGPIIYRSFYKFKLELVSSPGFRVEVDNNEPVVFVLKYLDPTLRPNFSSNLNSYKINEFQGANEDSTYKLTVEFKKSGIYDLQILANNENILSYQVVVK